MNLDEIERPITIIDQLFENYKQNPADRDFESVVFEYFSEFLEDKIQNIEDINNIPFRELKNGRLYSFRGMIQDIYDPEFFIKIYHERTENGETQIKTSLFKEEFNENSFIKDFDYQHSSEVLPLYCIPIPGETEWVKNINSVKSEYVSIDNISNQSKQKSKKKRSYNESLETSEDVLNLTMTSQDVKKKVPTNIIYNNDNKDHQTLRDYNFPIIGMKGSPCIIKIYGNNSQMFRVNDIYNFVGVYYLRKSDEIVYNQLDEDQIEEIYSADTPILHCLYIQKLGEGHPMISLNKDIFDSDFNIFKQSIPQIRNKLAKLLEFCFGDSLVAEYVILNMISRVHGRLSDQTPLGTLPLNIFNINDPNYSQNINTLLSKLVPKIHFIELNFDNIKKNNYIPFKNYTQGRLVSGELQLSAGTQLIIDECSLESCEFTGKAYKNIMGIKSLIDTQIVPYDFEFHSIEFFTDIPVLILSKGKSIFSNICQVPLVSHHSLNFQEALSKIEGKTVDILDDFRKYIGYIRNLEFKEGNENLSDYLSNEFIMLRQDNPNITPELFGHWLNLSKLVALSFGEVELGNEIWERTKNLEKERLLRL